MNRSFQFPLVVVFGLQCALVAVTFIVLIVMTSLMMDSATRRLVEHSIAGDMQYARTRILAPIQSYERLSLQLGRSYVIQSQLKGTEACAESLVFSDSLPFFSEAVNAITTYTDMSYLYVMRQSDTDTHPFTGAPALVECDVTPDYGMVINHYNESRLTTVPLSLDTLATIDTLPFDLDPTDYSTLSYTAAFKRTLEIHWFLSVYFEPTNNETRLYLSVFVPLRLKSTFPNGTSLVYEPNLYAPLEVPEDATATEAWATYSIDVSMSFFIPLMASVTPSVNGAHTSLYDLTDGTLVCTSAPIPLFDESDAMWALGQTPSDSLNDALAVYLDRLATGTEEASAPYVSEEDMLQTKTDVFIQYEHGRVISCVRIQTTSGINFVIVQSTPREHYFGPVTRLRTIMIIVGVVAAVAVVAVCVVIGLAIRIPLREVETNMQLAAVMKNDDVVPTTSVLAEVSALCTAFDRMNAKLLAARAFMPQAMLCEDTDDSMGDEGDINEEDEYAAHKPARLGADNTSSVVYTSNKVSESENTTDISTVIKVGHHNASTSDFHRGASTINKSNKHAERRNGLAATASGATAVVAKRVTILTVNARGFHDRLGFSAPSSVSAPAAELTAMVSSVCAAERGVIDSFHGDHFVLSFNAAKSNAQGPQKAMRAAAEIAQQGRGMSVPTVFSMGASTGRACVGQLGTAGLMRLSIVGPVYSRAVGLERVCRMVCERTSACASASSIAGDAAVHCVLDRYVASEVSHSHALQLLGWLSGRPFCDQSINKAPIDGATVSSLSVLYALRHGHPPSAGHAAVTMMTSKGSRGPAHFAEEADEWLYELQQVSATDPLLAEVNAVMLAYVEEVVAFVGTQPQTNTAQTHNALSSADQSLRGALELIQSKHEGLKVSGTHNLLSNAITPKNTNSFLKESSTQSIEESTLDGSITQSNTAWKPASNTNTGAANVQDHPHTSVHQNQRNDMRGWGRVAFLYATNVANGLRAEYTV